MAPPADIPFPFGIAACRKKTAERWPGRADNCRCARRAACRGRRPADGAPIRWPSAPCPAASRVKIAAGLLSTSTRNCSSASRRRSISFSRSATCFCVSARFLFGFINKQSRAEKRRENQDVSRDAFGRDERERVERLHQERAQRGREARSASGSATRPPSASGTDRESPAKRWSRRASRSPRSAR